MENLSALHEMAQTIVPAMKDAAFVRTWTGLRPGNARLLPYIGPAPGWRNLMVATGHYRKGTLLAPITGEAVAALVVGETPPVGLEGFSLSEAATGESMRQTAPEAGDPSL